MMFLASPVVIAFRHVAIQMGKHQADPYLRSPTVPLRARKFDFVRMY